MDELDNRLEKIEGQLDAIRMNTERSWRELLLAGFLRGTGIVIGGALTIALAGWGLTLLGIVPGAEEIADYLSHIILSTEDAM